MANSNGTAYSLTVLTPIIPGHEQSLEEAVAAIPFGTDGADSPFHALTTTHFARLVLIPQLVDEGPPQQPEELRSQYLLYSSTFTAALADHLEELRTLLQPTTDAIWGHCVGYPSAAHPVRFGEWFRHNQIDASFFLAAHPDVDLAQVHAALAMRERLIEFAVRGQGLPDDALLKEFRAEFVAQGVLV
jgi:hypothetical protein